MIRVRAGFSGDHFPPSRTPANSHTLLSISCSVSGLIGVVLVSLRGAADVHGLPSVHCLLTASTFVRCLLDNQG